MSIISYALTPVAKFDELCSVSASESPANLDGHSSDTSDEEWLNSIRKRTRDVLSRSFARVSPVPSLSSSSEDSDSSVESSSIDRLAPQSFDNIPSRSHPTSPSLDLSISPSLITHPPSSTTSYSEQSSTQATATSTSELSLRCSSISSSHDPLPQTTSTSEVSSSSDSPHQGSLKRHRPGTVRTSLPRSRVRGNPYQQLQWSPDGACLALTADDGTFATVYTDAYAKVWSARQSGIFPPKTDSNTSFTDAQPTPNTLCLSASPIAALDITFNTLYTTKFESPPIALAWHPASRLDVPVSSCIALSLQHSPVQLHDALNGEIRATYPVRGPDGDFRAPNSLSFGAGGATLVAGGQERLCVFAVDRDGGEPVCDMIISAVNKLNTRRYVDYLHLHWRNDPETVLTVQRLGKSRFGFGYGTWYGYGYGFYSNPYQIDASNIPENYLPLQTTQKKSRKHDFDNNNRFSDGTSELARQLAEAEATVDLNTSAGRDELSGRGDYCGEMLVDGDNGAASARGMDGDGDVDAHTEGMMSYGGSITEDQELKGPSTEDLVDDGLESELSSNLVLPSVPAHTLRPLPPRNLRKGPRGAVSAIIGQSAPAAETSAPAGCGHPDLWLAGTLEGDVALFDLRVGACVSRYSSGNEGGKKSPNSGGVTSLSWCQRPRWANSSAQSSTSRSEIDPSANTAAAAVGPLDLCFAVGRRTVGGVELWDMRQPAKPQLVLGRAVSDQQRMQVSCDARGQFLVTGSQDSSRGLLVYDLANLVWESGDVVATSCVVAYPHGVSPPCGTGVHPYFCKDVGLIASASGSREYMFECESENEVLSYRNSLKLWVLDW